MKRRSWSQRKGENEKLARELLVRLKSLQKAESIGNQIIEYSDGPRHIAMLYALAESTRLRVSGIAKLAASALNHVIETMMEGDQIPKSDRLRLIRYIRNCRRRCTNISSRVLLRLVLCRLGCKQAYHALVGEFINSSGLERMTILQGLDSVGSRQAHRVLGEICHTRISQTDRVTAATYLLFHRCKRGWLALKTEFELSRGPKREWVDQMNRARVLFGLAWAGDEECQARLADVAIHEEDERVLRLLHLTICRYAEGSISGSAALLLAKAAIKKRFPEFVDQSPVLSSDGKTLRHLLR